MTSCFFLFFFEPTYSYISNLNGNIFPTGWNAADRWFIDVMLFFYFPTDDASQYIFINGFKFIVSKIFVLSEWKPCAAPDGELIEKVDYNIFWVHFLHWYQIFFCHLYIDFRESGREEERASVACQSTNIHPKRSPQKKNDNIVSHNKDTKC